MDADSNNKCSKVVKALVIGAGFRGRVYSRYAKECPDELQIVGVAEPRTKVREWMKASFGIPEERCFTGWESAVKVDKFADCVFVCTQDQDHAGPAVSFASKGYHILLEKPMAVSLEDCWKIHKTCKENDVILAVCHELRYHPAVMKLKELISSGVIGDVVHITHTEPVGYWHFAHSFVRGNWRKESESTFSLLSKSCHDVDLLSFWMGENKCTKVSSFGSLKHFRRENKPKNGGNRCLDCDIEPTCPYSAKKIYLEPQQEEPSFPITAVCDIEEVVGDYQSNLYEAVKTGPYGRCVYECDNDVCDHQVVNFEYKDGSTATLTMIAFTEQVCKRRTEVFGTRRELQWNGRDKYIVKHYDFLNEKNKIHECKEDNPGWGHGGADYFIIKSFTEAIANEDPTIISTGSTESILSHLLTFAAETSRKEGRIVSLDEEKWNYNIEY